MTFHDDRQRQFEEYLRDGITAVKSGQTRLAESLFNRAVYINASDSRPFLWLSQTTKDPQKQIDLLEKAVGIDPTNISARRGLALLRGRIDESRLIQENRERDDLPDGTEDQAEIDSFQCPQCGGGMVFSILREQLVCDYCGFSSSESEALDSNWGPSEDRSEDLLRCPLSS